MLRAPPAEDDEDDFRAISLGHELLGYLRAFPDDEISQAILCWLDLSLTGAHNRALFGLPPRPAPCSGNVVPFRK